MTTGQEKTESTTTGPCGFHHGYAAEKGIVEHMQESRPVDDVRVLIAKGLGTCGAIRATTLMAKFDGDWRNSVVSDVAVLEQIFIQIRRAVVA